MQSTFDGVLLPVEMQDATLDEKRVYAAKVKQGNRAFIDAHFALEDAAIARGLSLDDLGR